MRTWTIACGLLFLIGCSEVNGGSARPNEGEANEDAGATTDAQVDPTGGRDSTPQSCFASCQNVSLTCVPKGSSKTSAAFLELSAGGCKGKLDDKELEVQCGDVTVCIDGVCTPATFSPFQFSYTPKGGKETVCIRD